MNNDEFLKIVVDIPNGDLDVYGEGLWSKALGNDLYEVQNSPWHSREINFLDIVRAISPAEDKNPVFVRVEKRGGHRTIQIIVLEEGEQHREEILATLGRAGATYENANGSLFALDFSPNINWNIAKKYLKEISKKGWLEYRWSAY